MYSFSSLECRQHNIKFPNQTLSSFFPSFIVMACCPRNTHQSWPIFGKLAEVPKPHVFLVPFQGEIFVSGLWMRSVGSSCGQLAVVLNFAQWIFVEQVQ